MAMNSFGCNLRPGGEERRNRRDFKGSAFGAVIDKSALQGVWIPVRDLNARQKGAHGNLRRDCRRATTDRHHVAARHSSPPLAHPA